MNYHEVTEEQNTVRISIKYYKKEYDRAIPTLVPILELEYEIAEEATRRMCNSHMIPILELTLDGQLGRVNSFSFRVLSKDLEVSGVLHFSTTYGEDKFNNILSIYCVSLNSWIFR